MSRNFELLVEGGDLFELKEDVCTVGRHSDCDICISDRSVSRFHCVLRRGEGGYEVTDGNLITGQPSFNGVKINGERLDPRHGQVLANGDVIELSSTARLKYFATTSNEFEPDTTLL